MSLAVIKLIATQTNTNITELSNIMYTAATVTKKEAGYFLKSIHTGAPPSNQTLWINHIKEKIINKRKDLSILNEISADPDY